MDRAAKITAIGAASAALLLGLTAAQRPSVLSRASGGLWELSGGPGSARQSRECLRDPALLAQIEHRRGDCTRTILRDLPSRAEVSYSCAGGGFGQTSITMVTPRSFRIETQGISAGAPFHYVVQARRVGNCAVIKAAFNHDGLGRLSCRMTARFPPNRARPDTWAAPRSTGGPSLRGNAPGSSAID